MNSRLNMRQEAPQVKAGKLTGKTVVFTGELEGFSRAEAEELVRRSGGMFSSSLSSKTDFLVAGVNTGSKFNKAKKLGLKIISERQFKEMVK